MHWVELDGNTEMFRRFLEAAALLQNPVAETVSAQESVGILRHHLPKPVDVHASSPVTERTHHSIGAFL